MQMVATTTDERFAEPQQTPRQLTRDLLNLSKRHDNRREIC
ncbi:hypothetical protein [Hoylesella marshii]|uniref:Uncharacterized protein n=1 Tax=Hoylesella marshii DSM 16973 = JCM 13450 TaxID=862515 RepID=E0NV00_9BACT|nr:hypothetical protein [Hoylesella marshii]EFM01085.1 hypothetical protein HMPREF0658_2005 [Hoylesella marshii DSM 16973 = JCM 13450]